MICEYYTGRDKSQDVGRTSLLHSLRTGSLCVLFVYVTIYIYYVFFL